MPTVTDLKRALRAHANPERAQHARRFFKTGPGEYGEGDQFLGLTVPQQRSVAKRYRDLPLPAIASLLRSPIHEFRFTALALLVDRYKRGTASGKAEIAHFYLKHKDRVNNWDLVDASAPSILGDYLLHADRSILSTLASSRSIWDRRIAVLATFAFIRAGQFKDSLKLATQLLEDPHDLMHKAVGWMLREIGKRDESALRNFLDHHASSMPRTMLRYAIERLSPIERTKYLSLAPGSKRKRAIQSSNRTE